MHSNHFSVVKPAVCRHCAGIVPAPHKKEKKEENNCAGAAPAPAGDVRIFVRRGSDFFCGFLSGFRDKFQNRILITSI